MKLTIATGILAQGIAASAASNTVQDVVSETLWKQRAGVLDQESTSGHLKDFLASGKKPVAAAARSARKGSGLAKALRKRAQAREDQKEKVPCDPKRDGAEWCGGQKVCQPDENSPLGGLCELQDGGILTNIKKDIRELKECDPALDTLADIGALQCGNLQVCQPDSKSPSGGFCAAPEGLKTENIRQLQEIDEDINTCNPESPDYFEEPFTCDCTNVDIVTGNGKIDCEAIGVPLFAYFTGCDKYSGDILYNTTFVDGEETASNVCYNVKSPSDKSVCLDIDYTADPPACTIQIDGVECNSCIYSDSNYNIDCGNIEGGFVGSTTEDSFTGAFFPQLEECNAGPCEPVCIDGAPYIADREITTEDATFTCSQFFSYGGLAGLDCYLLTVTLQVYCCETPLSLDDEEDSSAPSSAPSAAAVPEVSEAPTGAVVDESAAPSVSPVADPTDAPVAPPVDPPTDPPSGGVSRTGEQLWFASVLGMSMAISFALFA